MAGALIWTPRAGQSSPLGWALECGDPPPLPRLSGPVGMCWSAISGSATSSRRAPSRNARSCRCGTSGSASSTRRMRRRSCDTSGEARGPIGPGQRTIWRPFHGTRSAPAAHGCGPGYLCDRRAVGSGRHSATAPRKSSVVPGRCNNDPHGGGVLRPGPSS